MNEFNFSDFSFELVFMNNNYLCKFGNYDFKDTLIQTM